MSADVLSAQLSRPHVGAKLTFVLVLETHGRLREHLAHLELTRQLCQQRCEAEAKPTD